jgi:glucosamine 6-phosphate synthetase-like amidotransferase/phosphosugar isomerase protein
MCGIGGFIANSMSIRYKIYIARQLAYGLSERGTDSYGVMNEKGEWFKAVKTDIADFINDTRFKNVVINGRIIFIHTRYATKGKINISNCQPLQNEKYVLLHNGQIYGYGDQEHSDTKEFFQKLLKEDMNKVIQKADGWLALLIYSKEDRKVFAYKESSPLSYGYDNRRNLYFASTKEYLEILSVFGIRIRNILSPKECQLLQFSDSGILEKITKIAKAKPKWYDSKGVVVAEQFKGFDKWANGWGGLHDIDYPQIHKNDYWD